MIDEQLLDPRTHPVTFDINPPRAARDDEITMLRQAAAQLHRRVDLLAAVVENLDQQWKDAKRHGWLTQKADA